MINQIPVKRTIFNKLPTPKYRNTKISNIQKLKKNDFLEFAKISDNKKNIDMKKRAKKTNLAQKLSGETYRIIENKSTHSTMVSRKVGRKFCLFLIL